VAEATEPSPSIGESRPVVVVLGDFTHEGLAAKIESLGFEVINRRLRSTPANWQRITDLMRSLIGDGRLALLFAYIPTTSLMLMAEPSYDHVRPGLLAEIERTRAIFFVHEDNLQGRLEPLPWEVEDTDDATRERMDIPWRTIDVSPFRQTREDWIEAYAAEIARSLALIEQLAQRKIEPVPFRKRSDVTLRMFEALEEAQAGIFLRLYVPHGRYQSEQFEDFLTLFARYLRDVENKEFSVDVHRTSRGTTYVFKGRGDAVPWTIYGMLPSVLMPFSLFHRQIQWQPAESSKRQVQSRPGLHSSSPSTLGPFGVFISRCDTSSNAVAFCSASHLRRTCSTLAKRTSYPCLRPTGPLPFLPVPETPRP
jgi:hypothetical protein